MKTSLRSAVIGNFVIFQCLWFAAILGAARGIQWPVFVALALMLGWARLHGSPWRSDMRMAAAGLAIGLAVEPLWLAAGVIEYRLQWSASLPPLWILALWCGFAVTFNHSLAWLCGRRWLAVVFGALGSAGSVIAGVRLGAAEAPAGLTSLVLAYAALWAVIVPALAWWATRPPPGPGAAEHGDADRGDHGIA
ncbi:DUF2878 domain-containing protein [Isoalcanivorax indicus]|uniref:DUF2878 domain-containing protein n=1 Tax=Isoalcanivorax indicus TaxID=2202653 RepID=UPI000DBA5708|nr:DUF2878 domain-containing protein [Isoalcanivorax indicus]